MNATLVETLSNRANPGIDPALHFWGWEIPGYLFVGGLVAGLMILLAALELSRKERPTTGATVWLPLVAIGLISVGMLFLLLDLANPGNVLSFYFTFEPASPMSWGSWLLLFIYPALTLLLLGGLDERRRARLLAWRPVTALRLDAPLAWLMNLADRRRRAVLWTTLAAGVALGAYTGLLLGTLVARPAWNSALLAPLFLASGVSTAAALMLFTRLEDRTSHTLVRWDIAAIAVELFLLGALLLGLVTGGATSSHAASVFLGGPYTASFWSLVVIAGLLVPLALNVIEVRRHARRTLFAPALILFGGLALRAILVAAGQTTGVFTALN